MNAIYSKHKRQNADFAAGASASIKKTISEIEAIVTGESLGGAGKNRQQLHAKLQDAVIKSSKLWYKKGFNRGHRESYRAHQESGQVPRTLSLLVTREFIPNTPRPAYLKSRIK